MLTPLQSGEFDMFSKEVRNQIAKLISNTSEFASNNDEVDMSILLNDVAHAIENHSERILIDCINDNIHLPAMLKTAPLQDEMDALNREQAPVPWDIV
jgi:hypothetical protein